MRIRTSVLLAALAAVLSILTPSDAAAACGDCYDTGEGRHVGWETMGDESGWDEGHGWHFYSEPGDCLGNHGLCVIITEEEEEVSPAELTDLLASADAEAGRKVFNRCRACHKVEEGANGVGPHLHGVVGRDIAGVEGYRYSDALSGVDGVWTLDNLMEWLKAPNSFAPGNKMAMAFPDPQDRINVITYLNEADGSPEPLQ